VSEGRLHGDGCRAIGTQSAHTRAHPWGSVDLEGGGTFSPPWVGVWEERKLGPTPRRVFG
jgi:hypothetical protein